MLEHADREPIAFDGLRLEATDDGYTVATPAGERTGLSERDLREALADETDDVSEYVTNWYYWQQVGGEGTARRAFLRWCERAPVEDTPGDESETEGTDEGRSETARTVPDRYEPLTDDGLEREWGQLSITVQLADSDGTSPGDRVYDVRHVEDRKADLADLEIHDRPRDARDLTTADERGRYRPLKTAPTLVSGWAFTGLAGDDLVDTVEFVYPATVANWHREQRGNLDVDHWLETAERQTGIYDVVDELPREAVEWMAEACCVDSQCLRRREWEYEEDDDLSVDGGDGPFPCREPCSLVIAAARKWAILETEEERTWEFELTTSEKNQLEALLDAVADGRVDEIREADVNRGANRYRARYLRAKRVDDEGNLCGVDSSVDSDS
ncbi:DR2241 family protein [Natronoglomus mannanivorans]|uniref:DR2241 family protein n=1 Tax=Natronoglomus mannanivorans TaxID=2979990 RepID=A0AAP2YW52_9EURY|nr:DR2241 family protein [Halobacteria archaeon AArc-xg1-1]